MFTSPNGGGVIIAGGWNSDAGKVSSDIIELRSGAKNWTYLKQKLNQSRYRHVIMQIPMMN